MPMHLGGWGLRNSAHRPRPAPPPGQAGKAVRGSRCRQQLRTQHRSRTWRLLQWCTPRQGRAGTRLGCSLGLRRQTGGSMIPARAAAAAVCSACHVLGLPCACVLEHSHPIPSRQLARQQRHGRTRGAALVAAGAGLGSSAALPADAHLVCMAPYGKRHATEGRLGRSPCACWGVGTTPTGHTCLAIQRCRVLDTLRQSACAVQPWEVPLPTGGTRRSAPAGPRPAFLTFAAAGHGAVVGLTHLGLRAGGALTVQAVLGVLATGGATDVGLVAAPAARQAALLCRAGGVVLGGQIGALRPADKAPACACSCTLVQG